MEFFNSLAQALAAFVLALGIAMTALIGTFSNTVAVQIHAPVPSISPQPAIAPAPSASTNITPATTTPKKTLPVATKPKTPAPLPSTPPQTPAPTITADTIAQINTEVRPSVVNVLCSFRTANTSSYISGSGLIIDPRGVILTNAHVAQFLLLQNYPFPGSTSCTVRTGSPATAAYNAQLIYLPPQWVADNASQILSDHAVGTGERDYAFLYITGPSQFASAPPSTFPALSLSIAQPKQGDPVLLVGYPAGFLDAPEVQRSLYVSSSASSIQQLYAFTDLTHVDLVSLGGTVVSQGGSSGGAVINLVTDNLIGLISTESEGTTTASRDLRAVTLSYINRSLQADGYGGIAALLAGDLLQKSKDFNSDIAPALTKKLINAIEK